MDGRLRHDRNCLQGNLAKRHLPAGQSWSQEVNAQWHPGRGKMLHPVSASACCDLRAFKTLGRAWSVWQRVAGFAGLAQVSVEKGKNM